MSDLSQQGEAMKDGPSNEMILFGSDSPSEEFVERLELETVSALHAGVASLPGNVDAPEALVETMLKPYRKNMDVLERFCVGSIFTIGAHTRSRQDEIITTIQKLRSGENDVATLLAGSRHGGDPNSTASDHVMEDEAVAQLSSAEDVPTEEQVSAAQQQVADLRIRLAQLQRRKEALARQAEAWTDLQGVAAAAAGTTESNADGTSNSVVMPLLSPDDANKVHDLVSSAVVGTSMLTDLHQQGRELLQQLQDRSKNSSAGEAMEEEEEDDEGGPAMGRASRKRKTLEEQYAEDRAVVGSSSEEPPSAVIKQLLRQLRTGKENAEAS